MLGAVLYNMRKERGLKQSFDVVELRDYCRALDFPLLKVIARMDKGLEAMGG